MRVIDTNKSFDYDSILEAFHHGIDYISESDETIFKIDYKTNEEQKKGLEKSQEVLLLRKTKKAIEARIKNFRDKKDSAKNRAAFDFCF